MLEKIRDVVAAFIVLCILFFLISWNSPPFVSCAFYRPPHTQINDPEKPSVDEGCPTLGFTVMDITHTAWITIFPDVHSFFEGIIAMFTVVLGISTVFLWQITKRSVDLSAAALYDAERAYVVARFPFPVSTNDEKWRIQISCANMGRSLAIVKDMRAQFAPSETELPNIPPDDESFYESRETDSHLPAGVKSWTILAPFEAPTKTEGQVIYGYVLYEDVFKRKWKHRFSVAIHSSEKPGRHFYHPAGDDAYHAEIQISVPPKT